MSTVGRGFLNFTGPGEQGAFGVWFADQLQVNGGRNRVHEISGVSKDTLTKYTTGRSVPSRASLDKLIGCGVIGYNDAQSLAADAPWMAPHYVKTAGTKIRAKKTTPKPVELEVLPAANGQIDLLEAILRHPGLTTQQRVQLTALVTLVMSGTRLDINITPRL